MDSVTRAFSKATSETIFYLAFGVTFWLFLVFPIHGMNNGSFPN